MYDYNCAKCGGFVAEPMKAYGYAGQYCHCETPTPPVGKNKIKEADGTTFIQICTCDQVCPIHKETTQ